MNWQTRKNEVHRSARQDKTVLSENQKKRMQSDHADGISARDLGRRFGLSASEVWRVLAEVRR